MNKSRILIIEDQLVVAEDLARLLEESGYEIVGISETGEAAVTTALKELPDLVLVDIQLRGALDGIEAARMIKAHLNTAIVYLTAHSAKSLFARAKETEPAGYLYKPVSPIELGRTVEIVLFKHAMEKRLRESEQKYRALVEDSFDGIFVQRGTEIVFANSRLHEVLGYEQGELIGKDHWTIYHPDHRQMVCDRAQARLRGENIVDRYEVKLQSKDGTVLDGEIRAKAILFEGEVGIQVWVRDVTDQKRSQEEIRLLRDAVEQSHEGVAVVDLAGNIIFLNRAFTEMHGYSPEQLKGKNLSVFHTEDQMPEVKAANRMIQETGHFSGEIWHVRRDGTRFPTLMNNSLLTDEHGRPLGMIGTMRDITDLKKAEELLHFEKEQFQTLVNNAPFGLVIVDERGSFRYANPKFYETFGYSLEEVFDGRQWFRRAFPDPSLRKDAIATWLEDIRVRQPGEQRPRTFTVKCKDGGDKVIQFRPVQLPSGSHLVTCEDITERWRAEERLRESEEKFRRIIENLQDPFYRADLNGVFTFLSPASERVAGYKPEEGVGRPITMFYADPAERQEFMRLMMEDGFVNDFEARLVHKDGHIVWVSTSARLYKDKEGNIAGVEGIARDISDRKRMEHDLREREAFLRSVSDNLPSGMIYQVRRSTDGSRKFTYVSDTVREFYGCSPEEAMSDPELIYGRVFPEDRYRVLCEEEKAHSTLSDFQSEVRMINPSGDIRWSHFSSSPRQLEDGTTSWSGIEIDITERKRMEEALRESETKYRLMFEFSPFGVFHFDDTGTITACNDQFVKIIGSSREKLIGLNAVRDVMNEDVRAAVSEALSGRMGHYEGSYTSVTAHKTTPVRCEFAPILTQDGTVLGGIGIVEDISERKQAEQALLRSERLHRSVIENIEDVFYRSDAQGRVLMGSPSGARLFGYDSVDEMIGLPLESFWVYPEERRRLVDIVKAQGKVTDFEGLLKRKDGTTFVASISTNFYRDEGGAVMGTEGIVRDISERKQIEAHILQSQKLQAMGTLAGGVAHEINNLLQIVLGHADMFLLREGLDKKTGKSLEAICRAARTGSDLVNKILMFSRKAEPEMRPTDLSDELRKLEELFRRTIPRMITLDMSLDDNLRMISADPSQIEQILLNLAINARDAMPEGGRLVFETRNVTIREEYCRTHPEVKPGKYVLLTVSDTGRGMDKRTLDRVFEPFFTTKQPGEGTGLGLSVVFGVVKAHGAHITCYSEPGVGSTFKIYFPALKEDSRPGPATTIEMPAGGTETLLLVDDEEDVRTLGVEILELAGYTVLTAANGREALEVYKRNRDSISLVVLDLIMPDISGRRCLEELLKINLKAKVLIASGYAANGPAKEARESGAAGFVSKPYDVKEFLLAIRKCLDGS